MNTVAIIQARMSSTRLPGKVLLPLGETTLLGFTVARVRSAKKISRTIVATSTEKEDDAIADWCTHHGIEVFRGSLSDVLDRFYRAAQSVKAEQVVRITADCPLIDPEIIDSVVHEYKKRRCDYISTGRIRSTFPDGMDTEVFSFSALEQAWKEAHLPSEREHVTPYIWNHPKLFRVEEYTHDPNLSSVRLTVDEPRDYELVKHIVASNPILSMNAIVAHLAAHPEVASLNASIVRDEGYLKSLQEEAQSGA